MTANWAAAVIRVPSGGTRLVQFGSPWNHLLTGIFIVFYRVNSEQMPHVSTVKFFKFNIFEHFT